MTSNRASACFAALAQESRLAIFRLLIEYAMTGLSAGDISRRLKVPAPTLSFHLTHLRTAGLIVQKREGRSLIYAPDIANMNALIGFMTDKCCNGNPAACAPMTKSKQRRRAA